MDAHIVGRNRANPPQNLKTPCIDRASAGFALVGDMDAHMDAHMVGHNRTSPPQSIKTPCVDRASAGFDLVDRACKPDNTNSWPNSGGCPSSIEAASR